MAAVLKWGPCRCGSQQAASNSGQDCYADCEDDSEVCLVETGITGETRECVTCEDAEDYADPNTQADPNNEKSCELICKEEGSSFVGIELEGWQNAYDQIEHEDWQNNHRDHDYNYNDQRRCFCGNSVPRDIMVTCAEMECKVKIIDISDTTPTTTTEESDLL